MSFVKLEKETVLSLSISNDSKVLYSLIADRINLSKSNGESWCDNNGTFCLFTRQNMADVLNVCRKTVTKLMKELLSVGLVMEVRQGLGKPNKIYLAFDYQQKCKNVSSECVNSSLSDEKELHTNKTEIIQTEIINNNNIKEDDESSSAPTTIVDDEPKEVTSTSISSKEKEMESVKEYFEDECFTLFKRTVSLSKWEVIAIYNLCKQYSTSYVLDVLRTKVNQNNWLRINFKPYFFIKHFSEISNGIKYAQWC